MIEVFLIVAAIGVIGLLLGKFIAPFAPFPYGSFAASQVAEQAMKQQRRYEEQIKRAQEEHFAREYAVAREARKGKIIETEWKRI